MIHFQFVFASPLSDSFAYFGPRDSAIASSERLIRVVHLRPTRRVSIGMTGGCSGPRGFANVLRV